MPKKVKTARPDPEEGTRTAAKPEVESEPARPEIAQKSGDGVSEEATPPPRAVLVELVEGASYEVRGVRFQRGRPLLLSNQRVIAAVRNNSRFRVRAGKDGD